MDVGEWHLDTYFHWDVVAVVGEPCAEVFLLLEGGFVVEDGDEVQTLHLAEFGLEFFGGLVLELDVVELFVEPRVESHGLVFFVLLVEYEPSRVEERRYEVKCVVSHLMPAAFHAVNHRRILKKQIFVVAFVIVFGDIADCFHWQSVHDVEVALVYVVDGSHLRHHTGGVAPRPDVE